MLKTLQRTALASAFIAVAFGATAQNSVIVAETFQSWGVKNAKNLPSNDELGTCDPVQTSPKGVTPLILTLGNGLKSAAFSYDTTVTYNDLSIKYTIVNGATFPLCLPKSAYNTDSSPSPTPPSPLTTPGVSRGYVAINKVGTANDSGSFQTSAIPYVDSISFSMSATGSSKLFKVFSSVDNGKSWQSVLPYPGAFSETFSCGKTGDISELEIKLSNVMFKFTAKADIMRLHDFKVVGSVTTGLNNDFALLNGTNIVVKENIVTVTTINSGTIEIVNLNGVVAARKNITPGETSITIAESGLYLVRASINNQVAVKKIAIR